MREKIKFFSLALIIFFLLKEILRLVYFTSDRTISFEIRIKIHCRADCVIKSLNLITKKFSKLTISGDKINCPRHGFNGNAECISQHRFYFVGLINS